MYCPKGTLFVKSVDASNASKIRELLYGIIREVVLVIGPQYVVQFVTDNAANYVVIGKMLKQDVLALLVSLCSALHELDLERL